MSQLKINEFWPWCDDIKENNNLDNRFILCSDLTNGFGGFTVLYFIYKFIRDGEKVKIISCLHDRLHYDSIFRKFNLDLKKLTKNGDVEIRYLKIKEQNESKSFSEEFIDWKNLECLVFEKNRFSLVIDDLDALEYLAPDRESCRRFVSNIISYIYSNNGAFINKFVGYSRCPNDISYEFSSMSEMNQNINYSKYLDQHINIEKSWNSSLPLDEYGRPILAEYVRYRADVLVQISQLETGYSTTTHGIISISEPKVEDKRQSLLFKALDSGVYCSLMNK